MGRASRKLQGKGGRAQLALLDWHQSYGICTEQLRVPWAATATIGGRLVRLGCVTAAKLSRCSSWSCPLGPDFTGQQQVAPAAERRGLAALPRVYGRDSSSCALAAAQA